MRFRRWTASLGGAAVAALLWLGAFALPASAAKSVAWVASGVTPSAPFNSCADPKYSSIQEALSNAATEVEVCNGTYEEQLRVEHPVSIVGNGATVQLPAAPQKSETTCDAASEAGDGLEDQDLISICTPGLVKVTGLNVDAVWPGDPVGPSESCAFNLYGILVAGGADLQLHATTVVGAAPSSLNGCQYGVGIQIGMSYAVPAQAGTAKLTEDNISGYQKNGITVDGEGSSLKLQTVGVTGAGKTTVIAQNGIGVQLGAKAIIKGAIVKNNECENSTCGPDVLTQFQAEGVYFFGAAAGSSLKSSRLSDNDAGVETFDTGETAPSKAPVSILGNRFTDNRYVGVLLNQGLTKVTGNEIAGGNVGIEAVQFGGAPFGPVGIGSQDTITGAAQWALEGDSDLSPSDAPGSLTVKKSAISGNPGPTVAESVHTNNPTGLPIITSKDT
jgi:hypothetical protein